MPPASRGAEGGGERVKLDVVGEGTKGGFAGTGVGGSFRKGSPVQRERLPRAAV